MVGARDSCGTVCSNARRFAAPIVQRGARNRAAIAGGFRCACHTAGHAQLALAGMLRGDRTLMLRGLTRVVDALREASIDCAEAIKEWKQAANKPFEWNGRIYGARMLCDVATLDKFRFVAR